jgi:hypothetical protein
VLPQIFERNSGARVDVDVKRLFDYSICISSMKDKLFGLICALTPKLFHRGALNIKAAVGKKMEDRELSSNKVNFCVMFSEEEAPIHGWDALCGDPRCIKPEARMSSVIGDLQARRSALRTQ